MASLLLLEDDSQALEHALAFVDAWYAGGAVSPLAMASSDSEPTSASLGSDSSSPWSRGSDSSAFSPPSAPAAAFQRAPRVTAEAKKKREILLLRQEAAELLSRVELLRQQRRASRLDAPASGASQSELLASMWKDVAARQKKLRACAEAENERLRSEAADQEMMLRAVQNMLKRRRRKHALVADIYPPMALSTAVRAADLQLLEQICDKAEAEWFSQCGRGAVVGGAAPLGTCPPVVHVAWDSASKAHIIIKETRTMPFAFADIAEVMWDAALDGCASRELVIIEQMVKMENGVVHRRCREEYDIAGQRFALSGLLSARPRRDFHRAGYVIAGVAKLLDVDEKPADGASVRHQGALVISSVLDSFCQLEVSFRLDIDLPGSLVRGNPSLSKWLVQATTRSATTRSSVIFAQIENAGLGLPAQC